MIKKIKVAPVQMYMATVKKDECKAVYIWD